MLEMIVALQARQLSVGEYGCTIVWAELKNIDLIPRHLL